jgi:hypothetical protein
LEFCLLLHLLVLMMFVELLLNLEEGKVLAFFFSPEKEIIVFFFRFWDF